MAIPAGSFDDWLGKGRPAYVPRRSAPLEEAVQEIRHCQGVAVIAHPQKYGWTKDRSTLFGKFKRLKEVGVVGIETIHGEMFPKYKLFYCRRCR